MQPRAGYGANAQLTGPIPIGTTRFGNQAEPALKRAPELGFCDRKAFSSLGIPVTKTRFVDGGAFTKRLGWAANSLSTGTNNRHRLRQRHEFVHVTCRDDGQ